MRNVDEDNSSSDEEYPTSNKVRATVRIEGIDTSVVVDSGCPRNIIDKPTFDRISLRKLLKLEKTNIQLYSYGADKALPISSKFSALLETGNRFATADVYIDTKAASLLGLKSAQDLGLFTVNDPVNNITDNNKDFTKSYPTLFAPHIGKLKGVQVKLHIDESVPPVA